MLPHAVQHVMSVFRTQRVTKILFDLDTATCKATVTLHCENGALRCGVWSCAVLCDAVVCCAVLHLCLPVCPPACSVLHLCPPNPCPLGQCVQAW